MNFTGILLPAKKIGEWAVAHAPQLLTAAGSIGTIASVGSAIMTTPRIIQILNEQQPKTKMQVVKACWKEYIPTGLSTILSVACIIGSYKVSAARIASLAGSLALTAASLEEYKDKAKSFLGEKQADRIESSISQDHITNNPPPGSPMENPNGTKKYWAREPITSQYFLADWEDIRTLNNHLCDMTRSVDDIATLNDIITTINEVTDSHLEYSSIGDAVEFERNGGDFLTAQHCFGKDHEICYQLKYYMDPKNVYTHSHNW